MFTTSELDNYINQAATDYLKAGTPLNDTIIKIASDQGLNRDQIARVVEGANTEVYVQLMNKTADKYIQFDNASTDKVSEKVFSIEKVAGIVTDDYEEPPTPEPIDEGSMEKLAEVQETSPSEAEMIKHAYALSSLSEHLEDSLYEVDGRFQKNSDIFYGLVKQAYLGGTSFGDIRRAIETAYDSPVVATVLNEVQEKLATELYPTKLITEEHTSGSVNANNPIIKQASALAKDTTDFLTLREKIAEVSQKVAELSEVFDTARAYFKKSGSVKGVLGALAVGGVGGVALHSHLQNVRKQQTNMPLSQLPGRYAR